MSGGVNCPLVLMFGGYCSSLVCFATLQLLVGDEVLDVAEADVSGDHHFMFVRHTGFIQVSQHAALSTAYIAAAAERDHTQASCIM